MRRRFLKNCLKNLISLLWQPAFLMKSNSVNTFEEDLPVNISTKFGPNEQAVWEKMLKEIVDDARRTPDHSKSSC